jgi:cytochrome c-type biogenesis protein CcmH
VAIEGRGRKPRFVLIAMCGIALVLAAGVPLLIAETPKATVQEVAEGLTCQCGCGLTIANCNHPNCSFSVPAKEQIEAMIGRGMSRTAIIAVFRAKYGEKILSAPTTSGFNLLAWITPFAMLLGGGGLIALVLGRWHARGTPAEVPTSGPHAMSAAETELRRKLELDLRDRM